MNLPATGWLGARRRRAVLPAIRPAAPRSARHAPAHAIRGRTRGLLGLYVQRPGLTIAAAGFGVCAVSAVLEFFNPGNYWVLFEDFSCAVAPTTAAIAVAVAAVRGEPEYRKFRTSLAIGLALTAVGQIVADVPDILHQKVAPLGTVSDVCHVIGAVLGVATLMITLIRSRFPCARVRSIGRPARDAHPSRRSLRQDHRAGSGADHLPHPRGSQESRRGCRMGGEMNTAPQLARRCS